MIADDTAPVVSVRDDVNASIGVKDVDVNNVPVDYAYSATEPLVNAMDPKSHSFSSSSGSTLISREYTFDAPHTTTSFPEKLAPASREYTLDAPHTTTSFPEKLAPAQELEGHENTDDFGRPLEVPSVPAANAHGDSGYTEEHLGNELPAGEAVENLPSQQNVHIPKGYSGSTGSGENLSAQTTQKAGEPADLVQTIVNKYNQLPFWKFRMYILAFLLPLLFILPAIISGFMIGCYCCFVAYLYLHVNEPRKATPVKPLVSVDELIHVSKKKAEADVEVIQKVYKGWMNILNEKYNVHTSCYKDVQSVLVQLEGPLLKISRPERLVMKHSVHDDPTFTEDDPPMLSESVFNLTNAKIKLRPKKLARLRWWVRRYPICIILPSPESKVHVRDDERFAELQTELIDGDDTRLNNRRTTTQQLGVATDEALNLGAMGGQDDFSITGSYDFDTDDEEQVELAESASTDRLAKSSLQKNFPGPGTRTSRTIFLFARGPREKERWFHVLRKACNKYSTPPHESDALELEKNMLLPDGWTMPENMNKHYFLYVLQEYRYGKHLNRVLTDSVDNRTKKEHLLANDGIVNMDLGRVGWHRAAHYLSDDLVVLLNMFGSRILFDFYHDKDWCELIKGKIQAKIAAVHLPHFIETLEVKEFDMGNVVPIITKVYKPVVDDWGLWLDIDLSYEGSLKMVFETYVDFTKLGSKPDPVDTNPATGHENGPHFKEEIRDDVQGYTVEGRPCSPEMSPDEDFDAKVTDLDKPKKSKKNTAQKVLGIVNKVVKSDAFQKVTSLKPIKKTMEKMSSTPLAINVEVTGMEGTMAINIPPPPSDRLWYAFREPPKLTLKSIPQIGDRTVDFEKVSDWIETNIRELLNKLLVMPNMDDIGIPVLAGNELITGTLNE